MSTDKTAGRVPPNDLDAVYVVKPNGTKSLII
jgi:hypothetical protein